ncbi:MAG: rod shape-determining protein MreD [Tissierellia bacterium]|nr:rod shape-determining protein MreD [Tissierellia bacterium]
MKVIKNLLFISVAFILQASLMPVFEYNNVVPNFILVLVILIGMNFNKYTAAVNGAVFGLLIDIFFSPALGVNTLVLGAVGFICGSASEYLVTDNLLSLILYMIAGTILYNLFSSIVIRVFIDTISIRYIFSKIFSMEIIVNIAMAIMVFLLKGRTFIYSFINEIEGNDEYDEA